LLKKDAASIGGNRLLVCEIIARRIYKNYDPSLLLDFESSFISLREKIEFARITLMTRPIEQQVLVRLSEMEKNIWLICLLVSELYVSKSLDGTINRTGVEKWLDDAIRVGIIELIIKLVFGH